MNNKDNKTTSLIMVAFMVLLPAFGYWAAKIEFARTYESDLEAEKNAYFESIYKSDFKDLLFEQYLINGKIKYQETINGRMCYAYFEGKEVLEYMYREEIMEIIN